MDLTPYNLSDQNIADFTKCTAGYQAFILNDSTLSMCRSFWPPNTPEFKLFYERKQKAYDGTLERSHGHKNDGSHMVINKTESTPFEWNYYYQHNKKMLTMNDNLIELSSRFIADISSSTVLDVGCNDGSLLFSALKYGYKSGIGFDQEDHSKCIEFVQSVTKLDGKFIQTQYDMYTHRFSNHVEADFVICSAVLPHISDPVYFLDSLSKMTNKVLLLSGGISSESGKKIIYGGKPSRYGGKFPAGFTHANKITKELLEYSLTECGFSKIYEIEREQTWPDKYWYEEQGNSAIIAIK